MPNGVIYILTSLISDSQGLSEIRKRKTDSYFSFYGSF